MTARAERLLELIRAAELDLMLVSEVVNVGYLTGYSGSNGIALVGDDTRTFITDFRYVQQAAEEVDPSFIRVQAPLDLIDALRDAISGEGVRLGFEATHVSVREHERMRELLGERVTLVAVEGLVERLRAVKEPDEVEQIRAACELADAAFAEVLDGGLVGRSERDVAISLEQAMLRLGARRPSFETIIAAGPHGALPHAQPREVEIESGQLVVIDWGAELDGYCSDCTRTVATGELSTEARAAYELVREAQLAGMQAVAAGKGGRAVDAVARSVIDSAGFGARFGHGLGHGVGIEVHEAPRLSQRSDDTLQAGNVVSVEPGIYIPGEYGVRIEDLVVVTDDGCDVLTGVGKELKTVG